MDKFNRDYELSVQTSSGRTLTIKPPFTVEFDIHRNSFSSANVASFRIYNLSGTNRDDIRKDQYDYADLRNIAFMAGYNPRKVFKGLEGTIGQNLSLAFAGNITQAWSVREGNSMVTQIECFDGGFAYINAVTDQQFSAGTSTQSIVNSLFGDLKNAGVQPGKIGSLSGNIARGNSFSGNTIDILKQLSGGSFFIDNGKANVLGDDEVIEGPIQTINSASGLLGTPVREQTFLNFDMLFEPRLVIGQSIALESVTANNFNGTYKVIGLKHRGIISESICGDAITSVSLSYGSKSLTTVR